MSVNYSIKRLQSSVGVIADGEWGNKSQQALLASGKKLDYDWDKLRLQFGQFRQSQVDGFNAIVDAANQFGTDAINPLYFAYMLATAWHETAHTMQPIEEYGKGRGRRYGSNIDINGSRYQGLPHIYYGRGYVQLTWLTNYVLMGKKLGIDLVNNPSLALDPKHATDIMIMGMLDGLFTSKRLSDCIKHGSYAEFVSARRVINGKDKDALIAGHAVRFLDCLQLK